MSDPSSPVAVAAVPFVYPLDDFYASAGLRLPNIERVAPEDVPEPYRRLLVHNDDMTPTLEGFYGTQIHLKIIERVQRDDFYFREVVLQLDRTNQAVEFGAIKVSLTLFPPKARQLILEERVPLGRILEECNVGHSTVAKAFFRVEADELIRRALTLPQPVTLFGRRANILDSQKRPLAEIVEILPPIRNHESA